jgi:hypothetical protein
VVEDLVVLQDQVRQAAVVAEIAVLAHHLRVQPFVQHVQDAHAAIGRKATRQAAHRAADALGRLHDLVGKEIAHVLHARQQVLACVFDVAVPADAADRRIREALHQLLDGARKDERVRIHAHDELAPP